MSSRVRYMVFPAVGVARLGDSDPEYFLGPDVPILERRPAFNPPIFTRPSKVVAPARPETPKAADGKVRDAAGNIRRQAAVFRVYKVTQRKINCSGWVPIKAEEIKKAAGVKLKWTVEVANSKSFKKKMPSPLNAANQIPPPWVHADRLHRKATATADSDAPFVEKVLDPGDGGQTLGLAFTDDAGRLRFLAGTGEINKFDPAAPSSFANLFTHGWRDDVCDGVVRCEVTVDGKTEAAAAARIVTGVPAFARPVGQMVSLYDVAERIAVRKKWMPAQTKFSFAKDIYPMLLAIQRTAAVSTQARADHPPFSDADIAASAQKAGAAGKQFRRLLGQFLSMNNAARPGRRELFFPPHSYRSQGGKIVNDFGAALDEAKRVVADLRTRGIFKMPKQFYAVFLEPMLTRLMCWIKEEPTFVWGDGGVTDPHPALDTLPGVEQVDALNRAHMMAMLGGATLPGIEVGWEASITENFTSAFRYREDLEPGRLTWTLSIPWPKDYYSCYEQDAGGEDFEWWPASRPLKIVVSGSEKEWDRHWDVSTGPKHVTTWKKLGFMMQEPAGLVEREFRP